MTLDAFFFLLTAVNALRRVMWWLLGALHRFLEGRVPRMIFFTHLAIHRSIGTEIRRDPQKLRLFLSNQKM